MQFEVKPSSASCSEPSKRPCPRPGPMLPCNITSLSACGFYSGAHSTWITSSWVPAGTGLALQPSVPSTLTTLNKTPQLPLFFTAGKRHRRSRRPLRPSACQDPLPHWLSFAPQTTQLPHRKKHCLIQEPRKRRQPRSLHYLVVILSSNNELRNHSLE